MNTVKTTLFPESKNKSTYFDVEEGIHIYEKLSGQKVSENVAEIMRKCAPIINRAYEDGLKDGREAAANE